jgi:hypothetical protein
MMKPSGRAIAMLFAATGCAGFAAAISLATKPEQAANSKLVQKPQAASATNIKSPTEASTTSQSLSVADHSPLFIGDSKAVALKAMLSTKNLPAYVSIPRLALAYHQSPYNAFSLDKTRDEVLRIDLKSFDCFLFVEQLLALVNSHDVSGFAEAVRNLRYEAAQVNYCSRYHYFTHWADNAIRKGLMVNLSSSLSHAVTRSILLNYMTSHASAYAPMRLEKNRDCIIQKESARVTNQTYIPINSFQAVLGLLRSGDIFALVTDVQGLDVTHVGFLLKDSKGLGAIHAAPGRGVMISADFADYARSVPNVIGVAIYRPLSLHYSP